MAVAEALTVVFVLRAYGYRIFRKYLKFPILSFSGPIVCILKKCIIRIKWVRRITHTRLNPLGPQYLCTTVLNYYFFCICLFVLEKAIHFKLNKLVRTADGIDDIYFPVSTWPNHTQVRQQTRGNEAYESPKVQIWVHMRIIVIIRKTRTH